MFQDQRWRIRRRGWRWRVIPESEKLGSLADVIGIILVVSIRKAEVVDIWGHDVAAKRVGYLSVD